MTKREHLVARWREARETLRRIEDERSRILKPTERMYHAARSRLEEIEEKLGGVIGTCNRCLAPVFDGDRYARLDDGQLCANCAPSYADMARRPEDFCDHEGRVLDREGAQKIINQHVAGGGSIYDPISAL